MGSPSRAPTPSRAVGPGANRWRGPSPGRSTPAPRRPRFLYPLEDTPAQKITTIARALYGADGVTFVERAPADLERAHRLGLDRLPVCIAKTQASLGDDPAKRGRPRGFSLAVREIHPAVGAGFLVAHAGHITTMPGLPREPAALGFDIDERGVVRGLF